MCLRRAITNKTKIKQFLETKFFKKQRKAHKKQRVLAYKRFQISRTGKLRSLIKGNTKTYPIGVWLEELPYRDKNNFQDLLVDKYNYFYPTGFHAYIDKTIYDDYREYLVELKGIIALEQDKSVIVAKKMKILKKVD